MRNKILFLSMATMGGCQRVTVNYAKLLQRNGYNCEILLWIDSPNGNNVLERFIPEYIPVNYLNCRIRELPIKLYQYIRKNNGYDCVFSSWTIFNISLCIARLIPFGGIKHLVIRDDNMPSRHDAKSQKGLRVFGRFADFIIAQTEEMRGEMESIYCLKKNTITIHNPLDKEFIDASSKVNISNEDKLQGRPIYIASGRIAEQKDYITLVRAFADVVMLKPEAKLYIMGDADKNAKYLQEVVNEVKNLDLEQKIIFMGFRSNPYKFIHQADVFVLSSIYEGLPNVMIEAIYLGKPVAVSTCIPYIDQVIINGKNGFKASVSNPKELSSAMLKAYKLKDTVEKADITNSEEIIVEKFNYLLKNQY